MKNLYNLMFASVMVISLSACPPGETIVGTASDGTQPQPPPPPPPPPPLGSSFTVGSYNVYYNAYPSGRPELKAVPWTTRAPIIARVIQAADLDLVALQEIDKVNLDALTALLPQYEARWRQHGFGKQDGVAILVKKQSFDILDTKSPFYQPPEGWHDLYVDVKQKSKNARVIRMGTSHFKGAFSAIGNNQVTNMIASLNASTWNPSTLIAAGDFNSERNLLRLQPLLAQGFREDGSLLASEFRSPAPPRRIDFIFGKSLSDQLMLTPVELTRGSDDDKASDHFLVATKFSYNEK